MIKQCIRRFTKQSKNNLEKSIQLEELINKHKDEVHEKYSELAKTFNYVTDSNNFLKAAFENPKNIKTGLRVQIAESAVIIGNVEILDDSSVFPSCTIRGDVGYIKIGKQSNIQDNSVCHLSQPSKFNNHQGSVLTIGDQVSIGHSCMLHGATIENYTLVGLGCEIMDNAVVREQTLVGAGSLVPPGKELNGGLWVGRPAKKVRELSEQEKEHIIYNAENYVRWKNQQLARDQVKDKYYVE